MAKILLIKTSAKRNPGEVIMPPLGIMYLASILRHQNKHNIKLLDMRLDYPYPIDILDKIVKFKPDIIGISSLTFEARILHELVKEIRTVTKCKIICGGPHSTAYPEDIISDPNVDYAVMGEGENTINELVEKILSNSDTDNIEGIAFKSNKGIVKTKPRKYIQNLNTIPFPSWDLVPLKEYGKYWRMDPIAFRRPYMAIITSRGCPYNCIYCHNIFGKKFRARSPENVYNEIETLYRIHNIKDFEVIDDIFNLDKRRALDICNHIIKSHMKIGLSFPNGVRGDIMDEELLLSLRKAGTYQISYAIETGSVRIQKIIKKNVNLKKLNTIIEKSFNMGIITRGFFISGFPTESKDDLKSTLKFAVKSKLDLACFFTLNPFQNTEVYNFAKRFKKEINGKYENYNYNQSDFNLSDLKNSELIDFKKKLYRSFYLHPKRLYRLLLRFPNKRRLTLHFIIFSVRGFFGNSSKLLAFIFRLALHMENAMYNIKLFYSKKNKRCVFNKKTGKKKR